MRSGVQLWTVRMAGSDTSSNLLTLLSAVIAAQQDIAVGCGQCDPTESSTRSACVVAIAVLGDAIALSRISIRLAVRVFRPPPAPPAKLDRSGTVSRSASSTAAPKPIASRQPRRKQEKTMTQSSTRAKRGSSLSRRASRAPSLACRHRGRPLDRLQAASSMSALETGASPIAARCSAITSSMIWSSDVRGRNPMSFSSLETSGTRRCMSSKPKP